MSVSFPPRQTLILAAVAGLFLLAGTGCVSTPSSAGEPEPDPSPSVMQGDELYHGAVTMEELLLGRLPGVEVLRSGGGALSILIRGQGSIASGTEALIVIDGVQSDGRELAGLNPKDVARVEVVKDGTAALYGLRGANGVLIVTTKRY